METYRCTSFLKYGYVHVFLKLQWIYPVIGNNVSTAHKKDNNRIGLPAKLYLKFLLPPTLHTDNQISFPFLFSMWWEKNHYTMQYAVGIISPMLISAILNNYRAPQPYPGSTYTHCLSDFPHPHILPNSLDQAQVSHAVPPGLVWSLLPTLNPTCRLLPGPPLPTTIHRPCCRGSKLTSKHPPSWISHSSSPGLIW